MMNPSRIAIVTLVVLSIAGCNKKRHLDYQQMSATASKLDSVDVSDLPDSPKNQQEELYLLVQDWETAQNNGNFDTYASFYSPDFKGIKRVGKNEYKYNQQGWLTDRKKMFRKPMKVEAESIKIDQSSLPYKIHFMQSWQSGTFMDYGRKVLLVDQELKIVGEEMLESQLIAPGEAQAATDNPLFFFREGNYVQTSYAFSPGDKLKRYEICDGTIDKYELCIEKHIIKGTPLNDSLSAALGMKVYTGNIESSGIEEYTIDDYRMVQEELLGHYPGIDLPSGRLDYSFGWKGGIERFTPLRSTLHISSADSTIKRGQWAFVANKEPVVYRKNKLSYGDDKAPFYNGVPKEEHLKDLTHFYTDSVEFVVFFNEINECGHEFYEEVTLYRKSGNIYLFVKNLPDYPEALIDLEHDNDPEIIYFKEVQEDPAQYIYWTSPYYGLQGQDTVFLSCGC